MSAKEVTTILFSPKKVFREIVNKPKYIGVIIILIFFLISQMAAYYSYDTKNHYELTAPSGVQFGVWTQNSTLWAGDADTAITKNYNDFVDNVYLGNNSLEFFRTKTNILSLKLLDLNPLQYVDCGPDGFQNMSLRIKIIEPDTSPEKVNFYLQSPDEENYFVSDITTYFYGEYSQNIWNNLTLPINSGEWKSSGNPEWGNITGVKLDFIFPAEQNITFRIQGLFFRGLQFQGVYFPQIELGTFSYITYYLQMSLMQFLFQWLLITGLLYLFVKIMKGNLFWKPLFISVGFALVPHVIQALINFGATLTLPEIYYPLEVLAGMPEAQANIQTILSVLNTFNIITSIIMFATSIWITVLLILALRELLPDFSLTKNVLISIASVIGSFLILSLLG